jgi:membrane fusion protein, heavy metal efflux system
MKSIHKVWILFMSLLFTACSKEAKETKVELEGKAMISLNESQKAGISLQTSMFSYRLLKQKIKVNGKLDVPPQQMVSLSVPLGGFVKSIKVLQGSRVKKGELLAEIENPEYIKLQQEFLEAKNQEDLAQLESNRQETLALDQVNAEKTRQQAMAGLQQARIKRRALQARLKALMNDPENLKPEQISGRYELRSPIDGYVAEIFSSLGQFVSPTDIVFELVDTDHLHVELFVFEQHLTRLEVGQKIHFKLGNAPELHEAEIFLIGRKISESRTIRVHGHLKKENPSWLPGQFVEAEIETGADSVPCLPEEAFTEYKGITYLFVERAAEEKDQSMYEAIAVKAGPVADGFRQVSDLPQELQSERIVVMGAYYLLAKLKNSEEE